MSLLARFETIEEKDKEAAIATLVERASPDFDFFFMMTLAVLMASFGLLLGSETIVIGSMLLAPLLYPIIGFSLGLSTGDNKLLRRSFATVVKASVLSVIASAVAGVFFFTTHGTDAEVTPEILLRTVPSLLLLAVAVVSGVAVSYAMVKPKLSEILPGIAISVALIPPLAVVGIGFAALNLSIIVGAAGVFLLNIFGIVVAALVCFSLMGMYKNREAAQSALRKEEKRIEKEAAMIKEADGEAAA